MAGLDPGLDDAALVRRARQGDAEAFEALVRRHYRVAFAVARSRVDVPMDAEDVVQDSFVRALERLDDCDPSRFAGWLLRIVRNRAHNARVHEARRRGVDPERVAPAGIDGEMEAEARLQRGELRDALERAVNQLPPMQREVLLLHDLSGLPHAEIAAAVGVSVGMSRYHLMNARRRMRELLDRSEREGGGPDG